MNPLERIEEVSINGNLVSKYTYDPLGERVKKEIYSNGNLEKTVIYFYGQEGLLAEYDENMNLIKKYIYNPDRPWSTDPLWMEDSSGNKYFYINYHLFTPQKMIDENFNTVWQGDYFSFGNVNETVNQIENNLRFPGQYFDSETGFYYNFNRYYAPDIGRYLREDEVRNGLNYYLYVKDNPVGYFDSRGEDEDVADMYGKWPPPAPEDSIPDWCKCKKDRDKWYNDCVSRCMYLYNYRRNVGSDIDIFGVALIGSGWAAYFREEYRFSGLIGLIVGTASCILKNFTGRNLPEAGNFAGWWYGCRWGCSEILEKICYPDISAHGRGISPPPFIN